MLKIFVALSTFNRINITKMCLENLQEIINKDFNKSMLTNQKVFNSELLKDDVKIEYIAKKNKIKPDSLIKILELQTIKHILNENIDEQNKKPINNEALVNDIYSLLKNNSEIRNLSKKNNIDADSCLLYTSPSPRDS